jgi:hypothetical protein
MQARRLYRNAAMPRLNVPKRTQSTNDEDSAALSSSGPEHPPAAVRDFFRRPLSHPLGLLLLFTLLVRGGILLLTPGALASDPDGYRRLAENLVAWGTFGNNDSSPRPLAGEGPGVRASSSPRPLAGEGPGVRAADAACWPTAYRPPLYPLLLAACVACGEHARLAIGVLHVALGLATVWLVYVLGRWWGLGARCAAVAGLLAACDPILLAQSTQVMTETPAALLAVVGLLALTWKPRGTDIPVCPPGSPASGKQNFPPRWSAALAGGALALDVLCRPELLIWLAAAGVALSLRRRRAGACTNAPCRGAIASLAAFALGAAIVLSPWAIRNQLQFGRPIVTTTHGGYTLLLANNPDFYQWLRSGRWGDVWRSDGLDAAWRKRRPADELQADRLAYREAWAAIREQPDRFGYACLVRLGRLWSPLPHQVVPDESAARRWSRWAVAAWYVAEFVLAIWGVWRMARGRKYEVRSTKCGLQSADGSKNTEPPGTAALRLSPGAPFFTWGLLLVGCVTAVHTVYWTDMRMRGPLTAVVAIAAAVGLCGSRAGRHSCRPEEMS